ncbi:MAG: putative RNase H-like nuclease [Gammaproteobacteria bacterium]|jgi:predicted RNase H-like nuclease
MDALSTASYGIDGCCAGWFYVREQAGQFIFGIVEKLADLLSNEPAQSVVFIDMPIGLRDASATPRGCDVAARKFLGRPRSSSVFAVPLRGVLDCDDYASALAENRRLSGKGFSKQAFGIIRKIREVDELLANGTGSKVIVREIHPELCFWAFAGGHAMTHSKKTQAGFLERLAVLQPSMPGASQIVTDALRQYRRRDLSRDDIVDALAALATARQPLKRLSTAPLVPEKDSRGLSMENVYCSFE